MQNYLDLVERVIYCGKRHVNRTDTATIRVVGETLRFDLRNGLPLLTTRKLYPNAIIAELIGFIRGYTNAMDFRELGCKWWDANANDNEQWLANPHRYGEDDLGAIYGKQWRAWDDGSEDGIDQLANAVNKIRTNPNDRRIIVMAWNPADLDRCALPPCHVSFHFIPDPETKELSMTMTMRSVDVGCGLPQNIASYAILLELVAKATGYVATELVMFLEDCHIYENHIDDLKQQIQRVPKVLPTVTFENQHNLHGIEFIDWILPENIHIVNYYTHPPLHFRMAV